MTPTIPTKFVAHAMLCDSATSADGKLYIHGAGWNGITASTFPFAHARLGVAIVLDVPYTATNANHQLAISIQDEDGKLVQLGVKATPTGDVEPINKIGAAFNVGRPPFVQVGEAQSIPLAVNVDQLQFQQPGAYTLKVEIDGDVVESLSFRVQATPAQMLGFQPA